MMFVYVVTVSASAICAAPTIATSPLVGPLAAAAANDGISACSAEAPTRAPAPAVAVLPRNRLRSTPGSCCTVDIAPLLAKPLFANPLRRRSAAGSLPAHKMRRPPVGGRRNATRCNRRPCLACAERTRRGLVAVCAPAGARLAHGPAAGLAGRPSLARGQQVGQASVAAQPYASGHGVVERDTAARIVGRGARRSGSLPP